MRQNYEDRDAQPEIISDFAAAQGVDAVASKAADADQFWMVDWIAYSYDAAPTGGNITVQFGSTTVLDLDITEAGPGLLEFPRPLYTGVKNEALTITLNGAGAVNGKVVARIR